MLGPGRGGFPSKPCFSDAYSKSREVSGKKGNLGAELQWDQSSKESKHLLTQPWDTLCGLITSVGSQQSLLQTQFHRQAGGSLSIELPRLQILLGTALELGAGQLQGNLSQKGHGGMSSHPSKAGWHRQAASCTCRTFCPTSCSHSHRDTVPGSAPSSPFLGSIPQTVGESFWWALPRGRMCPAVCA